jgi:hypothetical protein
MSAEIRSEWEAQHRLLSTRLTGEIHVEDVAHWQIGLHELLAQLEEKSSFKVLVDLSGYELYDMAAHRAMRVVIPQLLAAYGMRPTVLDLFPEIDMAVTRTRGILCIAYANVHHDVDKIAEYERTLGRADQRFFTSAGEAKAWLYSLDERSQDA